VGLSALRGVTRRLGYDVQPLVAPAGALDSQRRAKLIAAQGITLALDVGANAGQWSEQLRDAGYRGRIASFEPLSDAFAQLERAASSDPDWEVRRLALGDEDGRAEINIAGNSQSSSLLGMMDRHRESAPESAYVGTEEVPTARLDTVFGDVARPGDRVYLKLDVQGFEMQVLRGAEKSLADVAGVQAELSLVPLYDGAPSATEMIAHLESLGFRLAGFEAGFEDPDSGEMLQADGLFVRA
jgi:FkbM family methyltransferase